MTTMTVEATKKQQIEVELSEFTLNQIALSGNVSPHVMIRGARIAFVKSLGFHESTIIDREGVWVEEGDRWTKDKVHRQATNAEKIFMETLRDLTKTLTLVKLS